MQSRFSVSIGVFVAAIAISSSGLAQEITDSHREKFVEHLLTLKPRAESAYAGTEQIRDAGGRGVSPSEIFQSFESLRETADTVRERCGILVRPSDVKLCGSTLATLEAAQHNMKVVCILRGINSCSR